MRSGFFVDPVSGGSFSAILKDLLKRLRQPMGVLTNSPRLNKSLIHVCGPTAIQSFFLEFPQLPQVLRRSAPSGSKKGIPYQIIVRHRIYQERILKKRVSGDSDWKSKRLLLFPTVPY
jgi:hypothetical protein